jgi:hypothetical protein
MSVSVSVSCTALSGSSDEEISDDEISSNVWKEIESESDEEFMEDHGLVEEVTSAPEDYMVNPIDYYRHFITDEIIDLMIRETNRYEEQYLEVHEISRRSKYCQWKPTTHEEMLKFFGIIIEMGLVQMPQLNHYWSSSQLYGLEIIRSATPRERGSNYSSSFGIFRITITGIRTKIDCSS